MTRQRRPAPPPAWPLSWSLAWRYLRGRQSRLLRSTVRSAMASTCLGVTAMVITMALMTGYTEDLEGKLLGIGAAVIAYPLTAERELVGATQLVEELASRPEIETAEHVIQGQGSVSSPSYPHGLDVTLRGVNPGEPRVTLRDRPRDALWATQEQLRVGADGVAGAVLGSELARRLGVEVGDVLRLVALGFDGRRPTFRYRSLRTSGTFTTGFAEADHGWLVMDRGLVQTLGGALGYFEVVPADTRRVPAAMAAAESVLGEDYLVTDWRQHNRGLFTALRLQKLALFLVLALIVVVSTFNTASSLIVLVREKIRDLGVLGALGMSPRQSRSVFVLCGGALGGVGVLLGVVIGWGAAWVMTTFELIRFDPEVAEIYFISSVPFRVKPLDVLAVVGFSLAVTLVASWLPARRAARLDPATALRYE